MAKPNVFIGSSVESLDYAYAVQSNLEYDVYSTVWTQGVFKPSSFALVDLTEKAKEVDFAIFIFSTDDITQLRDKEVYTVRDNVILEFGIFVGSIGSDRVFYISPRICDDLHLPTDILGLNPTTYDYSRVDNLKAALGSACSDIREVIKNKGCKK